MPKPDKKFVAKQRKRNQHQYQQRSNKSHQQPVNGRGRGGGRVVGSKRPRDHHNNQEDGVPWFKKRRLELDQQQQQQQTRQRAPDEEEMKHQRSSDGTDPDSEADSTERGERGRQGGRGRFDRDLDDDDEQLDALIDPNDSLDPEYAQFFGRLSAQKLTAHQKQRKLSFRAQLRNLTDDGDLLENQQVENDEDDTDVVADMDEFEESYITTQHLRAEEKQAQEERLQEEAQLEALPVISTEGIIERRKKTRKEMATKSAPTEDVDQTERSSERKQQQQRKRNRDSQEAQRAKPVTDNDGQEDDQDMETVENDKQQEAWLKALEEEHKMHEQQTTLNDPALRLHRQQKTKEQIALAATKILSDPTANLQSFTRIHHYIHDYDPFVITAALLSELALFKDLIPAYHIHLPTTKETTKLSKETLANRKYERHLLMVYQMFLKAVDQISNNKSKPDLRLVAVKCMAELFAHAPHFNFRANLIEALVPLLNERHSKNADTISRTVFDSMAAFFENDKTSGEASLALVDAISRYCKTRRFKRIRPELIDVLSHLPLNEQIQDISIEQGAERLNRAKQRNRQMKMKNRRKGDSDEKKDVSRDFAHSDATISPAQRRYYQTSCLRLVMVTYVRLLKKKPHSQLLFVALSGLAKFSHLINIEMLTDLLDNLRRVIHTPIYSADGEGPDFASEKSNDAKKRTMKLPILTALQALVTTFKLLSGQGEALAVDLRDFYSTLYTILDPNFSRLASLLAVEKNVELLISALDVMLLQPRQLPMTRAAAFAKRILGLSLVVSSPVAVSLLNTAFTLLQRHKRTQQMLDTEQIGLGRFDPLINDPDRANALNTTLWELSALHTHEHPAVRNVVKRFVKSFHNGSSNSEE